METPTQSAANVSGSCLCGAVNITANHVDNKVGVCHCNMCRKWGGGPFLAVDCGVNVTFNDDAPLTIYASSEWAERGFCKACGTHLFYRLKESHKYIMPVGLFNDFNAELDHQIFIDEKPAFYDFANKTTMMTGEECFAAFSEQQS
ncbi:GFA family protein [Flocculibacter collagenilyticus]|uniref:GFA family protein n=1 Tax=Flocculibacter collagenilyticus TaxID=2744479 RepID=UPI0018F5621F|nr:GFA family protein [Flocculibacter collagenilyticus]